MKETLAITREVNKEVNIEITQLAFCLQYTKQNYLVDDIHTLIEHLMQNHVHHLQLCLLHDILNFISCSYTKYFHVLFNPSPCKGQD